MLMKNLSVPIIVSGIVLTVAAITLFIVLADNSLVVEDDQLANSVAIEDEIFDPPQLQLEPIDIELGVPTDIANSGLPNDNRLFLVERSGTIKILSDGEINEQPFLDVSGTVINDGEQGLLGLAFHPDYAQNGLFYVNAVTSGDNNQRQSVVLEFKVSDDDTNRADAESQRQVIRYDQPFGNHNGGDLTFDSAGNLYIASGDGGDGGDPQDNGQNLTNLLGTIIRVDPLQSGSESYTIPSDNPFIGNANARDEIWAYGLRNPWRISFDSETEQLYIADVGQKAFEEVNRLQSTEAGVNFGWRCFEGPDSFKPEGCDEASEHKAPLLSYTHEGEECSGSITGGYVYRGTAQPDISGLYVFADYCKERLYAASTNSNPEFKIVAEAVGRITTFGTDVNEELYAAGISDDGGLLYRVVVAPDDL